MRMWAVSACTCRALWSCGSRTSLKLYGVMIFVRQMSFIIYARQTCADVYAAALLREKSTFKKRFEWGSCGGGGREEQKRGNQKMKFTCDVSGNRSSGGGKNVMWWESRHNNEESEVRLDTFLINQNPISMACASAWAEKCVSNAEASKRAKKKSAIKRNHNKSGTLSWQHGTPMCDICTQLQ